MGGAFSRGLKLYVFFLLAIAAVMVKAIGFGPPLPGLFDIAFFVGLNMFGEALPVLAPPRDVTVSVGFAVTYSVILLFGPGASALIAALGTISTNELSRSASKLVFAFNRAQLALSAAVGGLVFESLGGTPGSLKLLPQLPAMVAAGVAYSLVNTAAVALYVALRKGTSPVNVWKSNMRWGMLNYLGLMPIGMMIAVVYTKVGAAGAGIFVIPLLIGRFVFQRYIDMRRAFEDAIRVLSGTIDAKDAYTRGHSERVARYAVSIARELGFTDERLELIRNVALMHDLGKIGIPDSILNKPGRCTPEEFELVKRHPVIGANIMAQMGHLAPFSQWVRCHHERYDGGGFPGGLAGERIPLEARIIAVADAFDAITTDRPYRKAQSVSTAIAELMRCSGGRFDPEVVRAMVSVSRSVEAGVGEMGFMHEAASASGLQPGDGN